LQRCAVFSAHLSRRSLTTILGKDYTLVETSSPISRDLTENEIELLRKFVDESCSCPHEILIAVEEDTLFDSDSSDSEDE
jgi:hypothetical protein